ncbi:MAG: hypothetical protein LBB64_02825, partial [Dysgonamonadaceae bacterium]|nr:hypothetical protein [Dysgonamonadaceae bacterium]
YLTYQWYRITNAVPDNVIKNFHTPLSDADKTLIKAYGITSIAGGNKATLTDKTPNTAGNYYYWCEITNNDDSSQNKAESFMVKVKIVKKTLPSAMINGNFEYFVNYNTGVSVKGPAGHNVYVTDSATFVERLLSRYCDYAVSNPHHPAGNIVGWETTHELMTNAQPLYGNGTIGKKDIEILSEYTYLKAGCGYSPEHRLVAELSALVKSNLYQEIATVPGKIYEWSLDHLSIKSENTKYDDVMAVVIGPAINAPEDYNGYTNYWNKKTASYAADTKDGDYPYGVNTYSYFNAVVDKLAASLGVNMETLAANYTHKSFTVTYNDKKFYVYISNDKRNDDFWTHCKGTYSVPEGQGTTVFGFVSIKAISDNSGNILDNILFASGRSFTADSRLDFSGEASLSVVTEPGYAYGLAEVRGSSVYNLQGYSVTRCSGINCTENDASDYVRSSQDIIEGNSTDWYYPNSSGKLFFNELIPSKTYRIVAIPVGAISGSSKLNTNTDPTRVLDEGYYKDARIPSVPLGDAEKIGSIMTSTFDAGGGTYMARISVMNTNPDVEYALLDADNGLPVSAWHPGLGLGSNAMMTFDSLMINHLYLVVARPAGYTEIDYATAADYGVKVLTPGGGANMLLDILPADLTRVRSGASDVITIANSNDYAIYGLYDPTTGNFSEALKPGNRSDLTFSGLDPAKAYHAVLKDTAQGAMFMIGVRVYPIAGQLSVDYPNESVKSAADPVNAYIPHSLEYRLQANDAGSTWIIGDQNTWQTAIGISQLSLGGRIKGKPSVLTQMNTLSAPSATLAYRIRSGADGWTGPAVSPVSTLTFAARPAAPQKNTDYIVNYYREKIIILNNISYSLDNGNAYKHLNVGDDPSFASLEWTVAGRDIYLRLPATATSFASEITIQNIAGRGPAPVDVRPWLSSGTITLTGLQAAVRYQYKLHLQPDTSWVTVSGSTSISKPHVSGDDYIIRFAATDTTPASLYQVLSLPLSIVPVNFGNVAYGSGSSGMITVRNAADTDVLIKSISLTGADKDFFTISPSLSGSNNLVPAATQTVFGKNELFTITPASMIDRRFYTAIITLKCNFEGTERTTTANVYLNVIQNQWDDSLLAAEIDRAATTSDRLKVNISGAPAGSKIEYSIHAVGFEAIDAQPVGSNGLSSHTFTNLIPAVEYVIRYRIAADNNHLASDEKILSAYTAHPKPSAARVVDINYFRETLKFKTGYPAKDYEIKVNDRSVTLPFQVSPVANNGFSVTVVRRDEPAGNIPASEADTLIITGRADAPTDITTSIESAVSAYDGSITLPGNALFQWRIAGNPDIMANWVNVIGSTGKTMRWGRYEVRFPATATTFASKFATALILVNLQPSKRVIYVDSLRLDGYGNGDGSAWNNATPSLDFAFKHANDHPGTIDSILVARGTYYPESPVDGASADIRDRAFRLPGKIVVYGGYDAATGLRIFPSYTVTPSQTTLSGQVSPNVSAYHVVVASTSASSILAGFAITGGNADGSGSITVNGKSIARNSGGGIYSIQSTLSCIDVLLNGNKAGYGGAIYNASTSSVTLTNVTVGGNTATTGGGGINSAGTLLLNNTIVWGNTASSNSEVSSSNITCRNSLVKNITSAGTSDNNIAGNIDPLFIDASGGDYRLQPQSPVTDKGRLSLYESAIAKPPLDWTNVADLAGKRRLRNDSIDLGAFEHQPYFIWVGGHSGGANDNLWNVPSNWYEKKTPLADDFISFDANAKDLHIDGKCMASNISNTTGANLIIKKNASLQLSRNVPGKQTALHFTGTGKVFVQSGDTTSVNGALIVPKNSYAEATFTFYSKAVGPDDAKKVGDMSWQYFGIPVRAFSANGMTGGYIRRYNEQRKT